MRLRRPRDQRQPPGGGPAHAYKLLLRLAPGDLRGEGDDEMLGVFLDGYRDVRRRGRVALVRYWLLTVYDLLLASRRRARPTSPRPDPSAAGPRALERTRRDRFSLNPGTTLPPHRTTTPPTVKTMLDAITNNFRYAGRALRRAPGFTIIVVLTLALGIGANTAIFSVVDGVLLKPLPYPGSEDLVALWADYTRRDGPLREWLSFPNFADARALDDVFAGLAVYNGWGPTLLPSSSDEEPELLTGAQFSHGMFSEVLRIEPAIGRGFRPEEDFPGAAGTVLLSHRLWEQRYGADPTIVGRTLSFADGSYSVIGVMPADFSPPFLASAEIWRLARLDPARNTARGMAVLRAIGRLNEDVTLDGARAALDTLGTRLEQEYPQGNSGVGYALFPLHQDITRPAATGLWALMAAVGLVLLIACVNIANLMLAQATTRSSELAVRAALGATRRRIVGQLLAESALLAAAGGALGVLIGLYGTELLVAVSPPGTPRIESVSTDLRVLGFALVASAVAAVLFGVLPALRASRQDLHTALKEGGRGRDAAAHGRGLRGALVVVQVALALMLLVGAGLFVRTFRALSAVDLGFDPADALTVTLNLPPTRYAEPVDRATFYRELEDRLADLPGVESVGSVSALPLADNNSDADFHIEGRPLPGPGEGTIAWYRRVTPSYMEAIGLEIVAGRGFRTGDDAEAPLVVIINETIARRLFPGEDPVGKRLTFGSGESPTWRQIVGVARDIKNFGLRQDSRYAAYLPFEQAPSGFMSVVLRSPRDPADLIPLVRREIGRLDPQLAASGFATMQSLVDGSLAPERFITSLMGGFAVVALLLASVGLYGVVSYAVGLRMHEMGVRVTLGATAAEIRRLVVGNSLVLVGGGVVLGLGGAFSLTRLIETRVIEGLLFGVEATDPLTFVTVIAVLGAAATLAAVIPARRAATVDPIVVLNRE